MEISSLTNAIQGRDRKVLVQYHQKVESATINFICISDRHLVNVRTNNQELLDVMSSPLTAPFVKPHNVLNKHATSHSQD